VTDVEEKVCDKYCLDCTYFGGHTESFRSCNYYLTTDIRRPCPPGSGCTVKKKAKRKKKTKAEYREVRLKNERA
jgi:hypothetical protein